MAWLQPALEPLGRPQGLHDTLVCGLHVRVQHAGGRAKGQRPSLEAGNPLQTLQTSSQSTAGLTREAVMQRPTSQESQPNSLSTSGSSNNMETLGCVSSSRIGVEALQGVEARDVPFRTHLECLTFLIFLFNVNFPHSKTIMFGR